jgi:hypothetical protein
MFWISFCTVVVCNVTVCTVLSVRTLCNASCIYTLGYHLPCTGVRGIRFLTCEQQEKLFQ